MITFKFVRFTSVAYVSHTVNVLVTDIILNIKSQEHLKFTYYKSVRVIRTLWKRGTCKETTRNAFNVKITLNVKSFKLRVND